MMRHKKYIIIFLIIGYGFLIFMACHVDMISAFTPDEHTNKLEQVAQLQKSLSAIVAAAQKEAKLHPKVVTKEEGEHVAELAVTKERTISQRYISDLMLVYGHKLPFSKICYQAAISQYIDDQWTSIKKENGCENDHAPCDKNPQDRESKLFYMDPKDPENVKTTLMLGNVWYTAAKMYNLDRVLDVQLNPQHLKDYPPEGIQYLNSLTESEKKRKLDEFNSYINSCDKRRPAPWSVVGHSFSDKMKLTENAIKIGLQELLLQVIIARSFSGQENDMSCLGMWVRIEEENRNCRDLTCANTVVIDTKPVLTSTLDDLKAHQCSVGYIHDMIKARSSAVAPPHN